MRLNDSASHKTRQHARRVRLSVSCLVNEIVLSLGDYLSSSRITVELDVQPLEVFADLEMIRSALKCLMQNALKSMAHGGELSVTLIDSPHQWEIEVADTSTNRLVEASIEKSQPKVESETCQQETFFRQRPSVDRGHLDEVYSAADAHGGHVQTWDCPSGGTANVLVIPKRHRNAA